MRSAPIPASLFRALRSMAPALNFAGFPSLPDDDRRRLTRRILVSSKGRIRMSFYRPRTPRYPPRAGRPRRIPFLVVPFGEDDQLPLVFIPPSIRDARVSGAGCFVYGQWVRMLRISPFLRSAGPPLETSPAVWGHPRREESNHSITKFRDTTNSNQFLYEPGTGH